MSLRSDLAARLRAFRQTRFWRWVRWPVFAGTACLVLGLIALAILYATVDLPDDPPQLESSVVLAADGQEVAALQKDGLRFEVELGEVAPVVVEALIAAEDRRFYEHGGLDPIGLGRAIYNNVRGGELQGASTITQQLVKNSYLTQERTLRRKVQEAVLSVKLERSEDKDEILERYLNVVYFGRGTYGIEAAARTYFGTNASELTVDQAALLIGLLRAPETADPTTAPDVATERRNKVLDDLVETGDLDRDEAELLKAAPLSALPPPSSVTLTAGVAPHFVEWVRQQAVAEVGEEAVYGGGLRITTTLDLDDQRAAEAAIAEVLTEPGDPQAALVGLDREGNVRAYVGGRDFAALQVDLARGQEGGGSGRQPGSTFKPFVLATALEQGIPLGTIYPAPASIVLETSTGPYPIENYDGEEYGVVDLTTATANSINTVYAQLSQDVGIGEVAELATAAGITSELSPNASLVLGTSEVSVLDLADSFLTFARAGERIAPRAIAKIETPDGRVLYEAPEPETARAVQEGPALAVTYALQAVLSEGTGRGARLDRPAAGKTGTTQGYGDAWFAGYTPDYAAAVWLGYPEGPEHAMTDVHGGNVTGGGLPAEIWQRFMEAALADVEPSEFPPPPEELLAGPPPPAGTLTVSPTSGEPGTVVTVRGSGYEVCLAGWFVTFEPGGAVSPPEVESDASDRQAVLTVPAGAPPGPATITALCDQGTGAQPAGQASFAVTAPPTTTSTTAAPTTTTTRPPTTTTQPPTTTTTTSTSTTQAPGGGGGDPP